MEWTVNSKMTFDDNFINTAKKIQKQQLVYFNSS